jgi:photosystem II stability/assembly factor-like uncharacterized protein
MESGFPGKELSVTSTVWQAQTSPFAPNVAGFGFTAVNEQVCWDIGWRRDGSYYPGYVRTTNGGTTWICDSIPGTGNGYESQIAAIDADTAYVAVFVDSTNASEGIFKTTNGGATWTRQNVYLTSLYGPGYIHFFDANNGVAVGDPNIETYTTTNGGLNWNPISMPAALQDEYTWVGGHGISTVGNCVWFGTGQRIFKSTDRGYTWSASAPEVQPTLWAPLFAFQDSLNGLYARKKQGDTACVYRRTTDGGTTWNPITDRVVNQIAATSLVHMPGSRATYIVSGGMPQGKRGLARSYDGGNTWNLLDTYGCMDIAFASDSVGWGDDFYFSNKVFKYGGPPLGVAMRNEMSIPLSYVLEQNYPNPFNPTTVIIYQLSVSSDARLVVYDLLGREVALLVNGRKAPGRYEVPFDASALASGVYWYRLTVGGLSQTKKMLLLH